MRRRQVIGGAFVLGGLGVAALAVPLGAQLVMSAEDLPNGSPSDPAHSTPADTTAVQSVLQNSDVDAFEICVQDPAALHLSVRGVDAAGAPTNLDTVLFVFDEAGTLVGRNDDTAAGDPLFPRRSELPPGSVATSPGRHTVAVGHFRTKALLADDSEMAVGARPLASWYGGFGTHDAGWKAELLGGAVGSEGCVEEAPPAGSPAGEGVMTGNGRCQPVGGKAVEKGKAGGLETAAEHRQNETC